MSAVPDYRKYNLQGEKALALLGLLNGVSRVVINGHNPDIDIATVPEDLIPQGGVYTFPAVASLLEVLSSSAADASAGTGARTVFVEGLDANYRVISEAAILNGVGVVALTLTYLRVNVFRVVTAGSGLINAGTITLRLTGGGTTVSVIEVGFGLAFNGIYTVPADTTAIFESVLSDSDNAAAAATVHLQGRLSTTNASFLTRLFLQIWGFQSAHAEFASGILFEEKSDIRMRATVAGADNMNISLTLAGLLFRTHDDGL